MVAKGPITPSSEICSSDLVNILESGLFLDVDGIVCHQLVEPTIFHTPPAFYCLFLPLLVWLFASGVSTVVVVVTAAAVKELIPLLPGHDLLLWWWWLDQ